MFTGIVEELGRVADFASIITTLRKRRCSLSVILQASDLDHDVRDGALYIRRRIIVTSHGIDCYSHIRTLIGYVLTVIGFYRWAHA